MFLRIPTCSHHRIINCLAPTLMGFAMKSPFNLLKVKVKAKVKEFEPNRKKDGGASS